MEHDLKIFPAFYTEVAEGRKMFEIRYNDRGFKKGDVLVLREWDYGVGYTGKSIRVLVTFYMDGNSWGLKDGFCIMSIKLL